MIPMIIKCYHDNNNTPPPPELVLRFWFTEGGRLAIKHQGVGVVTGSATRNTRRTSRENLLKSGHFRPHSIITIIVTPLLLPMDLV